MVDDLFEVFEDLFERRNKKKGRRDAGDPKPGEASDRAQPPRQAPPLFCVDCGARNEASGRFCLECGKLLPAPGQEMRCIRCEQVVPLTAKFCPKCGTPTAASRED